MESSLGNPLFIHHVQPHPRASTPVHLSLFPKTINASTRGESSVHWSTCAKPACFRLYVEYDGVGHVWGYSGRTTNTSRQVARVTLSAVEDTEVTSSQFEDFNIVNTSISEDREFKIGIEVSGGKTEVIYNQVFDRMVEAAQPIPGFRREKGGKTPNLPKHILLEILGPSRVYKEVIKRIIDSTVAEYIEKKALRLRDAVPNALIKGTTAKSSAECFMARSFRGVDVNSRNTLPETFTVARSGSVGGYADEEQ